MQVRSARLSSVSRVGDELTFFYGNVERRKCYVDAEGFLFVLYIFGVGCNFSCEFGNMSVNRPVAVLFTDAKSVIKEFTTMLKSYNPETLEVKKNLITVDNVIIPAISENPIDIFANITQSKGTDVVNMAVAFSLGANVYITSSQAPSMFPTASNIIKVFANDLTAKNRDAILNKLGKELDKEEKKLASNEKKAAGYQKSIDGYQKNLDKAEGRL